MSPSHEAFAPHYAQARARLLQAAAAARARVVTYPAPGVGAQGETLALDLAQVGPDDSPHCLMLTSACHGVEGPAGSAVQYAALRDRRLLARLESRGVMLLIVHGLNAHGFSHSRRTTADNIDLNRNGFDFTQPVPANPGYLELHPLLLPAAWPPSPDNERLLGRHIQASGLRQVQATLSRGQHERPDGLFYGGTAPCWEHLAFRSVLRRQLPPLRRAAWIDLHTGLGPCGVGERIFTGGGPQALRLAEDWWGSVTCAGREDSASAALQGTLAELVIREWGPRLMTSVTLEFGTVPPLEVLAALRLDAWAHRAGPQAGPWKARAARALREAFVPDAPAWRDAVVEQAFSAIEAASAGLTRIPGTAG